MAYLSYTGCSVSTTNNTAALPPSSTTLANPASWYVGSGTGSNGGWTGGGGGGGGGSVVLTAPITNAPVWIASPSLQPMPSATDIKPSPIEKLQMQTSSDEEIAAEVIGLIDEVRKKITWTTTFNDNDCDIFEILNAYEIDRSRWRSILQIIKFARSLAEWEDGRPKQA